MFDVATNGPKDGVCTHFQRHVSSSFFQFGKDQWDIYLDEQIMIFKDWLRYRNLPHSELDLIIMFYNQEETNKDLLYERDRWKNPDIHSQRFPGLSFNLY